MKGCDTVRSKLLSVVGTSYAYKTDLGLWDVYLASLGYTTGTVADRLAKAAAAAGMGVDQYFNGEFGGLGPELAASVSDGAWTFNTSGGLASTLTQDGSGLHFVGANNVAAISHTFAGVDNATFQTIYTVSNYSGGGVRMILYGPTGLDMLGTTRNANGTYQENLSTINGPGSFNNLIRFQATGASGTNTYDITFVSVKRIV